MNNEKWSEICFLLHDNIKADITENDFEQCVIQALRVLNWKEYLGDIDIRPSFQIGASNRIIPDFVIKSKDNQKLFVIEIKQPNIPLNTTFQQQLFSYMRQLKLEYGILIGQGIQIFYDGNLSSQEDPVLLETIKFEKDSKSGGMFIELFDKLNYNRESLESFTKKALKKIDKKKDFKILTSKILSNDFIDEINPLIKQVFIGEYDGELIDSVLSNIKIEIKSNNSITHQEPKKNHRSIVPRNENHISEIEEEILKVKRKIPKWFNNPNQKNTKILISFMELLDGNRSVRYDTLESRCSSISNFKSNYDQMKAIGKKNHGKIFEEINTLITLWEPVKDYITNQYSLFSSKDTIKTKLNEISNNSFEVLLGKKYYNEGFFNVSVRFSDLLGEDNSEIKIQLGNDPNNLTLGHINRMANSNGTPRIFGGRELKNWIQSNFKFADEFRVQILSPNSIKVF